MLVKDNFFIIGPLGSRGSVITFRKVGKRIIVITGCFEDTIEAFIKKVRRVHKNTKHLNMYLVACELAKMRIG